MKIGVVGKPNVGKSTFFKAATLAPVEIANYPFVTIKPNKGFGHVFVECPDVKFSVKCQPKHGFCLGGKRYVPIELIDVAGLVPGAHEGKGLGNEFLNDLREADALIHVVDAAGTTNERGEPVPAGSHDPVNDIKFLEEEMDQWIYGILRRGWERFATKVQHQRIKMDEALLDQLSGLKVSLEQIRLSIAETGAKDLLITDWTKEMLLQIATKIRERSKPMVIAANKADLPNAAENISRIRQKFPSYTVVECSSECELALREAALHGLIEYSPGEKAYKMLHPESLSEKQQKALEFIRTNVLEKFGSTGVQGVINTVVFNLLKQIAVFPVASSHLKDKDGNILPDCFLVKVGTNAQEFAYKIHSDIGDKFVKALSLVTHKAIGREQAVSHLDVIEIFTS